MFAVDPGGNGNLEVAEARSSVMGGCGVDLMTRLPESDCGFLRLRKQINLQNRFARRCQARQSPAS